MKVEQHIYPLHDLKEHLVGDDDSCWCKPTVVDEDDGYSLITAIHHAADNREIVEDGKYYLQ